MSSKPPLVYLLLGATGSGRREVLADLVGEGLDEDESSLVLLSDKEPADARDAQLGEIGRWRWHDGHIVVTEGDLAAATHVFFVADGRGNPVDQIEAFKPWFESTGGELGRVITVVNCQFAEKHRELVAWYEACIHFSDIVLLAKREGVANKWLSDFQGRFKDQFFPCLFEFIKGGRVKNPALVLEPQPRRMSHYFDETDWMTVDGDDVESGIDDEEDARETNEEIEIVAEVDPYFERRAGGRRVKEITDIAQFLA